MSIQTLKGRRRWYAAASALLLTAGLAAPALADDLKDRQRDTQRDLRGAKSDLQESSRAAYAAKQRLDRARTQLSSAQQRLAATRGQLAAAQVLDERMQAELQTAEADLTRAREELRIRRQQVADQRDDIGRLAADAYQANDPDFMRLLVLFNTQTPAETTTQLETVDALAGKQERILDRLKALRAQMVAQEAKVETYGPLLVSTIDCAKTEKKLCYPHGGLNLELSNQVTMKDVKAHVRIEPPVPIRWSKGRDDDDKTSWVHIPVDLGPARTVRVVVTPGLKDEYGQVLAREHAVTLRTDDEAPNVTIGLQGDVFEAAKAKVSPTASATPTPCTARATSSGSARATTAAAWKGRTPERASRTVVEDRRRCSSWLSTPATATVSPPEVERNAANAPAAVSADRAVPRSPPTIRLGRVSTTESACPAATRSET